MTPLTQLVELERELRRIDLRLDRHRVKNPEALEEIARQLRVQIAEQRAERGLAAPWQVRRARYLRESGKSEQAAMEGL